MMFKFLNFQILYIHFFFFFIEIFIFRNCVFFSFFNVFDVIWFISSFFLISYRNSRVQNSHNILLFWSSFSTFFNYQRHDIYCSQTDSDSWNAKATEKLNIIVVIVKTTETNRQSIEKNREKKENEKINCFSFLRFWNFKSTRIQSQKIKWRNRQQSVRLLQNSWCIKFRWLSLSCCCCFMKSIFYKSKIANDF